MGGGAVEGHGAAVATLLPAFLALPQAFAQAIATYERDYIAACEKADVAVDEALLGPIEETLQRLSTEREGGEGPAA